MRAARTAATTTAAKSQQLQNHNWRFDIFDIVLIDFVTDSCFQWLTYGAQLPYRTVS